MERRFFNLVGQLDGLRSHRTCAAFTCRRFPLRLRQRLVVGDFSHQIGHVGTEAPDQIVPRAGVFDRIVEQRRHYHVRVGFVKRARSQFSDFQQMVHVRLTGLALAFLTGMLFGLGEGRRKE